MDTTTIRIFKSRCLHYGIVFFSVLTAVPLVAILGKVAVEGIQGLSFQFLTHPEPTSYQALVAATQGGPIPGGIANGLVGTLLMILMSSMVAIPVGILCGTYLAEKRDTPYARTVSYITDVLQGTPSIILGIIVYAWVVVPMKGYSAIAGSVALVIMMLPLIIRSTEESLKMLSGSLKEASLALGGTYDRMVLRVLIPSAFGQIFTGVLLAISRIVGETAPITFTALGSTVIQWDVTQPMSSVPLLIWQFYNNPAMQSMLWSASLVLLAFVLTLNVSSKLISRKWKTQ